MKGIKVAAAALLLLALCACGKSVDNYRVYDDLLVSFTSALGDRTLKEEQLTKSEDGRQIISASYTYKSKQAEEDRENYLYYLFNHSDAAFIAEDKVALNSRDKDYTIIVQTTSEGDSFTINIYREEL